MSDGNSFLDDAINDSFETTEKPFSQAFKIESMELGLQVKALIKTKVLDTLLKPGHAMIADSIKLDNNKPISEFFDKDVIGRTYIHSEVFHITGYFDATKD